MNEPKRKQHVGMSFLEEELKWERREKRNEGAGVRLGGSKPR
jgi:hypothetical protein